MTGLKVTEQQRAGMRRIIWTQCFAVVAEGTVLNGTLLLYLTAVGVDAARTMAYLAIPALTAGVLLLPLAFLADRVGKKRIGRIGLVIGILGWATVAAGPSIGGGRIEAFVVGGIVLAAVCTAMVSAGWFSLLSPIVPREIRGRYFGRLRMSFSVVMVALAAIYAWALARNSGIIIYQGIFAVATLAFVARWFSYRGIPELEPPVASAEKDSFLGAIMETMRVKSLAGYCSYIFLFVLFTAGAAALFAMTEKRVLGFTDSQVMVLANLAIAGSMVGMYHGGRVVDRHGTRFVFASCHVAIAVGLFAFLMRGFFPAGTGTLIYLGALHFALGGARGAIGIAMTTELMGLLPERNKSLAAAAFSNFHMVGAALSGFIPAWILKTGTLQENWHLMGRELSAFDAIVLAYSFMTLVLVATLGLVPSMLRQKAEAASLGLNRL